MAIGHKGYGRLRVARIVVSLAVMLAVAITVALGYHTFLSSWQLIPAILAGTAEWLLFWAAITALVGRLYCSTACPMGTLQDCVSRLNRRRNGFFYSPNRGRLRWIFVLVMLIAVVFGIGIVEQVLDPSSAFNSIIKGTLEPIFGTVVFTLSSGLVAAAVLAILAVFALKRGRLLCNTLCPLGTVLGAFSRMSLYHIDINTDKCVGCGLCTARCKAECIDPKGHTVDYSRCVVCFDCVAACPNDAISLRRGNHQLQWPLLQASDPEIAKSGEWSIEKPEK